jgi:hypothetical protein
MNPLVPSLFKTPRFSPFNGSDAAVVLVPIVRLVIAVVFRVVPNTMQ